MTMIANGRRRRDGAWIGALLVAAGIACFGGGGRAAAQGQALGPYPYTTLEPVSVAVIQHGTVRGQLTIGTNLMIGAGTTRSEIAALKTKIRDAHLQVLGYYASAILDTAEGLDVAAIKAALQTATDQVLGAGKVTVLINLAYLRRPG